MPIEPELFKGIASAFPTGVTIVTTVGEDGTPRGLTSNAFASVSLEPPLLLVCVDKRSRTLDAINLAGAFVINFLAAGRDGLSARFASKVPDKFAGVAWEPSAVARGAPVLHQDVVAYAECLVETVVEAGDHCVFIGRVEGGAMLPGEPLMYYRRVYAAWPDESSEY